LLERARPVSVALKNSICIEPGQPLNAIESEVLQGV
jgi:hypothetical protein